MKLFVSVYVCVCVHVKQKRNNKSKAKSSNYKMQQSKSQERRGGRGKVKRICNIKVKLVKKLEEAEGGRVQWRQRMSVHKANDNQSNYNIRWVTNCTRIKWNEREGERAR